ncbi:MAG: hypothetical protein ACFB21_01490 [Opitutales bacterium]
MPGIVSRLAVLAGWLSRHPLVAGLLGLVVLAWVSRPLENAGWSEVQAARPELAIGELRASAGQGVSLALIGGFRSLAADFAFLSAYLAWEDRQLAEMRAKLELTTLLDPMSAYFWKAGGEMIALDVPGWRIDAWQRRHGTLPPDSVQRAIRREQFAAAQRFLDNAPEPIRESFAMGYDLARWHYSSLRDQAAALDMLESVIAQPEATPGARRWYAELLWDTGRRTEAIAYLRAWLAAEAAVGNPLPMDGYLRDLLVFFEAEAPEAAAEASSIGSSSTGRGR